ANGIMFDVLLMACALIAVLGVIDIAQEHRARGVAVMAVGIGLGILAKGPVVLLDVGLVALFAPWWSEQARAAPWRYFGAIVLGIVFGALIGLAWAIPAALHGGSEYANTILFKQTFDRVSKSFAHRQPFWWYAVILPPMLLPWLIVLRGRWSAIKPLIDHPLVRFALAWVVPSVIAFSLVSGKQGHYLLPILPGFALLFSAALAHGAMRVRMGLLGLGVIAIGSVFVVLPYIATSRPHWNLLIPLWPLWGLLAIALGVAILVWRKRLEHPCWPALVSLAIVMLFRLAIAQGPGHAYDPTPIAERIRAAQLDHQPIIHIGWHHGVFEFAGRLSEPLATLPLTDLAGWVARNPGGLVVSFEPRFRFKATPLFDQPFRGARAAIWNAHAALESGMVPKTDSTPDDGDLSPDED
ncbi:MAG: glycosyl transferase, partial [Dokdonella sp.]